MMMLKRIAAAAACALLLVSSASAQLIGSGHVMGNGTASPATPTDSPLIQVLNQSGSGLGSGVSALLAAPAQVSGGLIPMTGTLTPGDCVSIASGPKLIDAGGACTVGGGGGTVSSATIGQLGVYAASGNTISGRSIMFNPVDFGAIGNGSTDDTAAWQSLCSAVSTAGSGWIWSPPGKTYLINSATTSLSQTEVCGLTAVTGVRVDMNGSRFLSSMTSQFVFGGSATNGDTITITFASLTGAFTPQAAPIPVTTGMTTTQMATNMAAEINSVSTLAANNIAATSTGNVLNITRHGSTPVLWNIALSPTCDCSGITITGAATETVTQSQAYVFYLHGAVGTEINDLQGVSLSGWSDANSNRGIYWISCATNGVSGGVGCDGAHFNRVNLSGGVAGVTMNRTPGVCGGLQCWGSRNVHIDGYCNLMGYCIQNQFDGINTDFIVHTSDVGRSSIIYNVWGVNGTIYAAKDVYAAQLNDMEVTAYGHGGGGNGDDISQNSTRQVWLKYINRNSNFYGQSFLRISHQQADPSNADIPTIVGDVHVNFNVMLNGNPSTSIMFNNAYKGTSTNPLNGDVAGDLDEMIEISGNIDGNFSGSSFAQSAFCLNSSQSAFSCSGYSGLGTGVYWMHNLYGVDVSAVIGKNTTVTFDNWISASAPPPSQDSGATNANLGYRPPVYFNGLTLQNVSCSGSAIVVSHGAVTAC